MQQPAEDTGSIARSASKVSLAVMCSRVLGLVREQAFAILFGAGFAFDAFVVAFRIPNLLRDLFGEGALSAAFVTVFSDYETNKGERQTLQLAGNVLVFFTILLSIIILVGMWQADDIVRLMVKASYEQDGAKMQLTTLMTVIMFPFLLLVSLASVSMGILNTRGHFFIPSLASSFFNLGSIIGGVLLAFLLADNGQPSIVGMAFGTLIGGLLQLVGQFPSLRRAGFRFIPNLDLRHPGLRRILKLMLPAVAGLAALQVNVLLNTFFASSLQEGSLSWLSYGFRFFMFPVGVFGVAISIAAHPVMARQAARGSLDDLKKSYVSTLTIAFCLTIPATVGLIMLAEPIIRLIFQHGRFDAFDTMMTSQALIYFMIGLFSYSSVKITVPVFYNINLTRYPVAGSFLAVAVNVTVILLTIDLLQHRALALSISCAMTANFLFLFMILYRKLQGFPVSYLLTGLLKVMGAAVVMTGWLELLDGFFWQGETAGILLDVTGLLVSVFSGAVVYGVVLYGLQLPEMKTIAAMIAARIRGGGR